MKENASMKNKQMKNELKRIKSTIKKPRKDKIKIILRIFLIFIIIIMKKGKCINLAKTLEVNNYMFKLFQQKKRIK